MESLLKLRVDERPVSSLDQAPQNGSSLLRRVFGQLSSKHPFVGSFPSRQTTPSVNLAPRHGDVLLIVPPFASLYVPSLGVHTLQACALQAGHYVDILYANFLLAALIGEDPYNEIAWQSIGPFVAERIFSRWAFGLHPLGRHADQIFELPRMFGEKQARIYGAFYGLTSPLKRAFYSRSRMAIIRRLARIESVLGAWLEKIAAEIVQQNYRIVGCSSTFEQTLCSIALLNRVKAIDQHVVTILGGANCEAEMAEGIASLKTSIDYIFSGESEETFTAFLHDIGSGKLPRTKIIEGKPCENMDAQPTPSFHEFFEQRGTRFAESKRPPDQLYLTYETSRGCWWGQKQHCTFCGLNGQGMVSRRKSAGRVIEELKALVAAHPTRNIGMADNIMPHEYFTTLLPKLSAEVPGLNIFYEQKANLTLPQLMMLKEAGITTIQPGIEALSSPMLQLMKKGVQAWQNLLLLRYARIAGVRLSWALLCGFPGDQAEVYSETLKLIRSLHHLPPPTTLWHLTIDRFSPYFTQPLRYGIKNIAPYPAYHDIFPEYADLAKLAYHFVAEYHSAIDDKLDVAAELGAEIAKWRRRWQRPYTKRSELKIERQNRQYVLIDTRGIPGTEASKQLREEEAAFLLSHRPYRGRPEQDTAIEQKLAVVLDGWFIPLPVARIDLVFDLMAGEGESTRHRDQLEQLGGRRDPYDVKRGLMEIACSGAISALEHPLAPP